MRILHSAFSPQTIDCPSPVAVQTSSSTTTSSNDSTAWLPIIDSISSHPDMFQEQRVSSWNLPLMPQLVNRFSSRKSSGPLCASCAKYQMSMPLLSPSEDCKTFEDRTKDWTIIRNFLLLLYMGENSTELFFESRCPELERPSPAQCGQERKQQVSLENAKEFPSVPPISHLITWKIHY